MELGKHRRGNGRVDKIDNHLSPDLLRKMNAYWRAANYLRSARFISMTIRCFGAAEIVARESRLVVGHWGTTPGQNSSMCI